MTGAERSAPVCRERDERQINDGSGCEINLKEGRAMRYQGMIPENGTCGTLFSGIAARQHRRLEFYPMPIIQCWSKAITAPTWSQCDQRAAGSLRCTLQKEETDEEKKIAADYGNPGERRGV